MFVDCTHRSNDDDSFESALYIFFLFSCIVLHFSSFEEKLVFRASATTLHSNFERLRTRNSSKKHNNSELA